MAERQTSGIFRSSGTPNLKTPLNLENLDMLEYPFLTLTKYPPGFIVQFGTAVCARSVKLLEKVPNQEEPETRDSWWMELRMEIRSHARALGCNVVLGYTEITSIWLVEHWKELTVMLLKLYLSSCLACLVTMCAFYQRWEPLRSSIISTRLVIKRNQH